MRQPGGLAAKPKLAQNGSQKQSDLGKLGRESQASPDGTVSRGSSAKTSLLSNSRSVSARSARPSSAFSLAAQQSNAESAVTTRVVQLSLLKENSSSRVKTRKPIQTFTMNRSTTAKAPQPERFFAETIEADNGQQSRLISALSSALSRAAKASSAQSRKSVKIRDEGTQNNNYADVPESVLAEKLQNKDKIFEQTIVPKGSIEMGMFREFCEKKLSLVHEEAVMELYRRVKVDNASQLNESRAQDTQKLGANSAKDTELEREDVSQESKAETSTPSSLPSREYALERTSLQLAQETFMQSMEPFITEFDLPVPDNAAMAPLYTYKSTAGRELADSEYFARKQSELDSDEKMRLESAKQLQKQLVKIKCVAELKQDAQRREMVQMLGGLDFSTSNAPEKSTLFSIESGQTFPNVSLIAIPQSSPSPRAETGPEETCDRHASGKNFNRIISRAAAVWVPEPKIIRGISQGSITEDMVIQPSAGEVGKHRQAQRGGRRCKVGPASPAEKGLDVKLAVKRRERKAQIVCDREAVVFSEYKAGVSCTETFTILNQQDSFVRLRVMSQQLAPFFSLDLSNPLIDLAPGIQAVFKVTFHPYTEASYASEILIESTAGDRLVIKVVAENRTSFRISKLLSCTDDFHRNLEDKTVEGRLDLLEYTLDMGVCQLYKECMEQTRYLQSTGHGPLEFLVLDDDMLARVNAANPAELAIKLHNIKKADTRTGMRSEREALLWQLVKMAEPSEMVEQRAKSIKLGFLTLSPQRISTDPTNAETLKLSCNPSEALKQFSVVGNRCDIVEEFYAATVQCKLIKFTVKLSLQTPAASVESVKIFGSESVSKSSTQAETPALYDSADLFPAPSFCPEREKAYLQLSHVRASMDKLATLYCDLGDQVVGGSCTVQIKLRNTTDLRYSFTLPTADYPSPGGRVEFGVDDKEIQITGSGSSVEPRKSLTVTITYRPQQLKNVDKVVEIRVPQSNANFGSFKLVGCIRLKAASVPRYVQILPHLIDFSTERILVGQHQPIHFDVANKNDCVATYVFTIVSSDAVQSLFTNEEGAKNCREMTVSVPPQSSIRVHAMLKPLAAGNSSVSFVGHLLGVQSSSSLTNITCRVICNAAQSCASLPSFLDARVKETAPIGELCFSTLRISNGVGVKPIRWSALPYSDFAAKSWSAACVPDAGIIAPGETAEIKLAYKSETEALVCGGIQLFAASIRNAYMPEAPKSRVSKHVTFNQRAIENREAAKRKVLLTKWDQQSENLQLTPVDVIPFYIQYVKTAELH